LVTSVAVGIICKTPQRGASKTRLSPPLQPDECAEISGCFIGDLAATIDALGRISDVKGYAVYTPVGSEDRLRPLLPPRFDLVPQGSGDLGARLDRGIRDLIERGHVGAILVNSDSPTLPPSILQDAVEALRRSDGDRMAIGPAIDGGYTFIGLTRPHPEMFTDIPWSTSAVFDLTLERAREIGLETVILDSWYDVDDADSYALLQSELDGTPPYFAHPTLRLQDAPNTRRFLTRRRAGRAAQ
jgi:hypothetical protein